MDKSVQSAAFDKEFTLSSAYWVLLLGASFFVLVSGKNVAYSLYLCALLAGVFSTLKTSAVFGKTSKLLLCLSVILIFSPIDYDVRTSNRPAMRFLPVVYDLGSAESVRREQVKGKTIDEDFIVKTIPELFVRVRYSAVLFVPWVKKDAEMAK